MDTTESVLRRAWNDTECFRKSPLAFFGVEIVGALVFAGIGYCLTRDTPSKAEAIFYPGMGVVLGFVFIYGVIFLWNLFSDLR